MSNIVVIKWSSALTQLITGLMQVVLVWRGWHWFVHPLGVPDVSFMQALGLIFTVRAVSMPLPHVVAQQSEYLRDNPVEVLNCHIARLVAYPLCLLIMWGVSLCL